VSVNLEDQLAKLGRYEALFELTGAINASANIDDTGEVLARRLKYVADVFAWRYLTIDEEGRGPGQSEPSVLILDGFRGRAECIEGGPEVLSSLESQLWDDHRARVLCEGADAPELESLPDHFRRPDVAQIYAHPILATGERRALFLFCKRRQPFNELDLKFVGLVCGFFHRRVQMLWEQRKLRELETAYLQQEMTLRQSEKLATLGKMSAGMAHELNNPAAAALRSAQQLREEIARIETSRFALGSLELSAEQIEALEELETITRERAKQPDELDALERSDLEERFEDWLDERGLEDPWEQATVLAAMGMDCDRLETLADRFDATTLAATLESLAGQYNAYRLLEEMGHGVSRISDIVRVLKSYSYMDQAPVQQVDVRQGLDDTLVMLHNKLKGGVKVEREYEEDLPCIEAYGSELNQVWTNIVDNAVTAMQGTGTLELKAWRKDARVVVEISDSGPGISAEVRDKVFDPFFTTKAPGEGTGLGLNISHNIIAQKHQGEISVASRPGRTTFAVKLPLTLSVQKATDEAVDTPEATLEEE
jgi:signal transduction histidine kinase